MTLTELDLRALAKARELADAYGFDAVRKVTGTKSDDLALVYGEAFGAAQVWLRELIVLAERLGAETTVQS